MADLPLSTRVFVRDSIGRFAKRVGEAVDEAMQEAAETGMRASVAAYPTLGDTFYVFREGQALYGWASAHPWAEGLDQGIPRHFIPANFDDERWPQGFLANKSERFFATGPGVKHPGVTPGHFFRMGYDKMVARMGMILKKHAVKS